MKFWFEGISTVHQSKADQNNADAFFHADRKLCVCDGVGGVSQEGLIPSAMSIAMASDIDTALERRLAGNAQTYDRNAIDVLVSLSQNMQKDDQTIKPNRRTAMARGHGPCPESHILMII